MKWSIIRVGIVALFMGMTTIVSGMTWRTTGRNDGQNATSVNCSSTAPGGTV